MALPIPPREDASQLYKKSPLHLAIFNQDYAALKDILNSVAKPPPAGSVTTEKESLEAERDAIEASKIIDFREVPGRESPLCLAVRLRDPVAVEMLMLAGVDVSLQNAAGWTPLQEAVCLRDEGLTAIILRHYQVLSWCKYMRRLPALSAVMRRMRDFYMELTWRFESRVIPFIARIAPSDTYRVWKRGSKLRADMTLAGFDGFRIKRKQQSLLFFGDGCPSASPPLKPGTLLMLNHEKKEVFDTLEGAGVEPTPAELAQDVRLYFETSVFRAGIDTSGAHVAPQSSWRGGGREEKVGRFKSRVYEMQGVNLRFKSRKVKKRGEGEEDKSRKNGGKGKKEEGREEREERQKRERKGKGKDGGREVMEEGEDEEKASCSGRSGGGRANSECEELGLEDVLTEEERRQLEKVLAGVGEEGEEEEESLGELLGREGEGGSGGGGSEGEGSGKKKMGKDGSQMAKSMKGKKEKKSWGLFRKKSMAQRGESEDGGEEWEEEEGEEVEKEKEGKAEEKVEVGEEVADNEDGYEKKEANEYKKGLKPLLWLTKDFPLSMTELMPLLDLLANKVKAVRRVKELLMTKLPPNTVPVKVAIPLIPTIRVCVTFSKFEEHIEPNKEEAASDEEEFFSPIGSPENENKGQGWLSWVKGRGSGSGNLDNFDVEEGNGAEQEDRWIQDPFEVPSDYKYIDLHERKRRDREKRKQAKAKARAQARAKQTAQREKSSSAGTPK